MSRQLTVHNAEVRTATVEVRTLTISGKQVTLAVFRQLIEAELVDDNGNFRGMPWGTVNYHPGKCDTRSDHRHVVWQLGNELRRASCKEPFVGQPGSPVWLAPADSNRWLDAAIIDGWRTREPLDPGEHSIAILFDEPAGLVRMELNQAQSTMFQPHGVWKGEERKADALAAISKRSSVGRVEAQRHVVDTAARVRAEWGRFNDRWIEIQALPQLFIAV